VTIPPRTPRTDALDAIPRLGWVSEPSPVTLLPRLAESLGLASLAIKRDDLLSPLHGGSKPRKLDYLLATAPFAAAPAWHAIGAVGSGNLVAVAAAAARRERRLLAHVFWAPLSPSALDNIAFVASGPTDITYYGSRTTLGLRSPGLFLRSSVAGAPVIPPGATTPRGDIGLVRAGLELAEQVASGELPSPDRIYVSFGSGGTAVGLALGLALGGLRPQIVGVCAVERVFSLRARIGTLERQLRAELGRFGLADLPPSCPITLDHGEVGEGYSFPTPASLAACERLGEEGLSLEPAYTGKAMAGLLRDAKRGSLGAVLFWHTARRDGLPHDDDWRARLPPALARRLAAEDKGTRPSRRRVFLLGAAAATAALVAYRVTGYPPLPGWNGLVLSAWEASVVRAAAEALLPPAPDGGTFEAVPAAVDRYLHGMPEGALREVHAMLALVEHGTTPLGGRLSRLTALPVAERRAYLEGLESWGGLLAQAYAGIRDLCFLAYYQQPSTWSALGYDGPRVAADAAVTGRMDWPAYDGMVAPQGTLPRGVMP
jgi:D-cysteine desulfhydrase